MNVRQNILDAALQCFADVTEQAIIADRQTLQSEICKKMELIKRMEGLALLSGLPVYNMIVGIIQSVFAQQSQPEEKPNLTPFDPECSTCVREAKEEAEEAAKRVERMISSADRIAALHKWQARDALAIQQLNESNQKLSEENYVLREKIRRLERDHFGSILAASEKDRQRIAQLEKEKHALQIKEKKRRETRSDWHTHFCDKPGCETTACECPTNFLSAS